MGTASGQENITVSHARAQAGLRDVVKYRREVDRNADGRARADRYARSTQEVSRDQVV